jgi:hypothetical protein
MVKVNVPRTGHVKKPNLDNGKLTRIGNRMVKEQKARWEKHINANGQQAKPLNKKYVFIKKKVRNVGRPYRDNNLTGVMLKNFILRKAINGVIRAENTSREARQHARQAQLHEEMIGLSGSDQAALYRDVQTAYGALAKNAWYQVNG